MGKFRQISTELWPLIYFKISFPGSILSIYCPFFFKLSIGVHIKKEWFWIEDGQISSNKYRVMTPSFTITLRLWALT